MSRIKLTEARVEGAECPLGKREIFLWDSEVPGLALRVLSARPSSEEGGKPKPSRKTWIYQARLVDGRQTRQKIGVWPTVKLDEARKKSRPTLSNISQGADPAAEKRAARAALRVVELAARYLIASEKKNKASGVANKKRALMVQAKPLHEITVTKVTRQDVARVLDTAAEDRGGVASNRLRAALASMWSWAISEGLCETNPVASLTKRGVETARERVLTETEIAVLWQATERGGDFDRIVRLALLTGARRAEIGSASGAEIVGDVWRIPGSRTKNSRANTIPLSPFMLSLFPAGRGPEPLFGQGGKGFGGWSKSKARLDGRMKEILAETEEPFLEWHLHDLRRTFATGLQRLGIRQEVTESLLNHVSGKAAGIVGVYQRHDYGPEKLHALAAWEAEVLRIVGAGVAGANVVALRAG